MGKTSRDGVLLATVGLPWYKISPPLPPRSRPDTQLRSRQKYIRLSLSRPVRTKAPVTPKSAELETAAPTVLQIGSCAAPDLFFVGLCLDILPRIRVGHRTDEVVPRTRFVAADQLPQLHRDFKVLELLPQVHHTQMYLFQ